MFQVPTRGALQRLFPSVYEWSNTLMMQFSIEIAESLINVRKNILTRHYTVSTYKIQFMTTKVANGFEVCL